MSAIIFGGHLVLRTGKNNPRNACPHRSTQTHDAGLHGSVKSSVGQVRGFRVFTSITDRGHFAVAGRIVNDVADAYAFANNFPVAYHNSTRRKPALGHRLRRFFNGQFKESFVCFIHLLAPDYERSAQPLC